MIPVVFMFSGQGSQYFQMGKTLWETEPVFKKHMLELDEICLKYLKHSIVDYTYDPAKRKSDTFNSILHSHPAIFMVEYACAQTLIHKGIIPVTCLGASLGEFCAAVIAGLLSAEEALALVIRQSQCLDEFVVGDGDMAAIIADDSLYFDNKELSSNVEWAGKNFNNHFVVSGTSYGMDKVIEFLFSREVSFQKLNLGIGFHSEHIDEACEMFNQVSTLAYLTTSNNDIEMFSCMRCGSVNQITSKHFGEVVRKPIRFQDSINQFKGKGDFHYVDLGPSGTLASFVKYNLPRHSNSKASSTMSMFGDNLDKVIQTQNTWEVIR